MVQMLKSYAKMFLISRFLVACLNFQQLVNSFGSVADTLEIIGGGEPIV